MEINNEILNEIERFEQCGTHLDVASFVSNLKEILGRATPEGFVLISKKLSDELNDHLWDFMTDNFISTNEDGDSYIACDDFDLGKFYSEIIEAQEQSHD